MAKKTRESGEHRGFEFSELKLTRRQEQRGDRSSERFTIFFPGGFKTTISAKAIKEVKDFIDTAIDRGEKQDRGIKLKARPTKEKKSA